MDKVFKALADETRRNCSTVCTRERADAGRVVRAPRHDAAGGDQASRLLEEANLVVTVWRGREKLHYLNPVPIHEIAERWIGKFERHAFRR